MLAGRYRLESVLGQGGMGFVMGGKHELTGRSVAVKLLLPSYGAEAEIIGRFFQEAKAAASLNHPNVVDVLDMQIDDGEAFLVLELLELEDAEMPRGRGAGRPSRRPGGGGRGKPGGPPRRKEAKARHKDAKVKRKVTRRRTTKS